MSQQCKQHDKPFRSGRVVSIAIGFGVDYVKAWLTCEVLEILFTKGQLCAWTVAYTRYRKSDSKAERGKDCAVVSPMFRALSRVI